MELRPRHPEDMSALRDMRNAATTPDEHDILDDLAAEVSGSTVAGRLGQSAVEDSQLVQLPDGVIVDQSAIDREHDAGRSINDGAYARRA